MLTSEDGKEVKDCSNCLVPHSKNGYDYIIEKLKMIQNSDKRGE